MDFAAVQKEATVFASWALEYAKTMTYDGVMGDVRVQSDRLLEYVNPGIAETGITRTWPLARGEDAFLIAFCYLTFVFLGRIVMIFLPPIRLSFLKYMYNPAQVLLCGWMSIEALRQAVMSGDGVLLGMNFDINRTGIASVLYIFYLSKIFDFFDTLFIILEKDWRRLSFLHVYHHWSIFLVYWMNLRAGYDGDIYLTIVLNGFVHFVMYTYYMITALGLYLPITAQDKLQEAAKALKQAGKDGTGVVLAKRYSPWWKSLVTYMQMVQFVMMNLQAGYILHYETPFPRQLTFVYLFYVQTMLVLFGQFALKNYCFKKDGSGKKNNHKKKKH